MKEEELKALSEEDLKTVLLEMGLKPPATKKEMINLILFEKTKVQQNADPGGGGGEGEEEGEKEEEEEIKKEKEGEGEEEKKKIKKKEEDEIEKNDSNENAPGMERENEADDKNDAKVENEEEKKEERKEENDEDIFNKMAESPSKMEVIDDDVYSSAPADVEESNLPPESAATQNDKPKEEEEEEGDNEINESNENAAEEEEIVEAKSCVVHVAGFVRPFSTQDAEELFTRCGGAYNYYWMNRVKSLAYVSYKTEEAAARAVRELDGMALQNGTKAKLTAKFGEESVAIRAIQNDAKVNRSPLAVKLVKEFREKGLIVPEAAAAAATKGSNTEKEEGGEEKESVAPGKRPLGDEKEGVEGGEGDVEPQNKKKRANTRLDELFMKTKCEPHLYYLPLTDEEVAERDKARKEKRKKEKKESSK